MKGTKSLFLQNRSIDCYECWLELIACKFVFRMSRGSRLRTTIFENHILELYIVVV